MQDANENGCKKSTGFDNIAANFFKTTPLAGIWSNFINLFLRECAYPDMMKLAEQAALLKWLN